jgi:hypothetical protein
MHLTTRPMDGGKAREFVLVLFYFTGTFWYHLVGLFAAILTLKNYNLGVGIPLLVRIMIVALLTKTYLNFNVQFHV